MIDVCIYWYFIKYQAKQRPLVPYYYNISELKETRYQKHIIKWKGITN